MTSIRPLDTSSNSSTRRPLPVTAAADDRLIPMIDEQTTWVAVAVAQVDPQQWLFTQRSRFLRHGSCDPWAKQMLLRAGLLPLAS